MLGTKAFTIFLNLSIFQRQEKAIQENCKVNEASEPIFVNDGVNDHSERMFHTQATSKMK